MPTFDTEVVRRLARSDVGRRIRASRLGATLRRKATIRLIERRLADAPTPEDRSPAPEPPTEAQRPARFVLVCEHRTGSNLVVSELQRRWAEIVMYGEAYRERVRDGESAADVSRRLFDPPTEQIVGSKLMYGHVTWSDLAEVLTVDRMRAIHLRRYNQLRRYVSLRIADEKGLWVQRSGDDAPDAEDRRVDLDLDRFLDTCLVSLERSAEATRVLTAVPTLDVWYEDLARDPDGELRRIARFLGVDSDPRAEGSTALRRQNPEPTRALVRNFPAIAAALEGTALSVFLDPD